MKKVLLFVLFFLTVSFSLKDPEKELIQLYNVQGELIIQSGNIQQVLSEIKDSSLYCLVFYNFEENTYKKLITKKALE